jgi:hypothetical protein
LVAQSAPATLHPLTSVSSKEDARLALPCTLKCDRETLPEILQKISQQSKVRLTLKGTALQSKRMYAFVKGRPLAVVMNHIRTINNLTWAYHEVNQEREYVLYQSKKNRDYLQSLQDYGWENLINTVQTAQQYLSLSPNDLKLKVEAGDPIAEDLVRYPSSWFDVPLVSWLGRQDLERLRQKETLTVFYPQLPPSAQQAMRRLLEREHEESHQHYKTVLANRPNAKIKPPPDKIAPEQASIRISLEGEGVSMHVTGFFHSPYGLIQTGYPYRQEDVDAPWFNNIAEKAQKTVLKENRMTSQRIQRELQFKTEQFGEYLKGIHETTGKSLFADAYPTSLRLDVSRVVYETLHDEGTRVASLFDGANMWQRRYWQTSASGQDVLLLREDWYRLQDLDGYIALLAKIKDKHTKEIPLSLEDIATIVLLPTTQRNRIESTLPYEFAELCSYSGLLKFYQNLSSAQKTKLLKEGLRGTDLQEPLLSAFLSLLQNFPALPLNNRTQEVRLSLQTSQASSKFVAEITQQDSSISQHTLKVFEYLPETMKASKGKKP